jgi:predicted peptidase
MGMLARGAAWCALALAALRSGHDATREDGDDERAAADDFVTHVYTDAQGRSMTYYLHVPAGHRDDGRFPLVLLLHGSGERGTPGAPPERNRARMLRQAYVRIWAGPRVQRAWPCFVAVPQVMGGDRWVGVLGTQGSYSSAAEPSASLALAGEILDTLLREYPGIDRGRLYLVGVSMGGYGAWEALQRWPALFAAAAVVAGGGDPGHAEAIAGLPIWAFHGAADPIVPVAGSREMVQALRAAGGSTRYTEYAGAGHAVWMRAFASPGFLAWLFAQGAGNEAVSE